MQLASSIFRMIKRKDYKLTFNAHLSCHFNWNENRWNFEGHFKGIKAMFLAMKKIMNCTFSLTQFRLLSPLMFFLCQQNSIVLCIIVQNISFHPTLSSCQVLNVKVTRPILRNKKNKSSDGIDRVYTDDVTVIQAAWVDNQRHQPSTLQRETRFSISTHRKKKQTRHKFLSCELE
jgi:hypothetical protein